MRGETDRQNRNCKMGSLAAHGLLVWFLLQKPAPQIVRLNAVRPGRGGVSLTLLYSPTGDRAGDGGAASNQDASGKVSSFSLPRAANAKLSRRPATQSEVMASNQGASTAVPAGTEYGSSPYGLTSGEDVRPAYPIAGPNPRVALSELPNQQEGNLIVEITIDEQGIVVRTRVLKSMGQEIDERAVRAVEQWRFQPAMRQGKAMVSLQDVVFHFPA